MSDPLTPREELIAALERVMGGPGFWDSQLAARVSGLHAALSCSDPSTSRHRYRTQLERELGLPLDDTEGEPMTDTDVKDREIVAVRREDAGGHEHVTAVKLKDGTVEDATAVVAAIKAHEAHYTMRPPEGAPAYEAHQVTGLHLLVEARACPECGAEVLFA